MCRAFGVGHSNPDVLVCELKSCALQMTADGFWIPGYRKMVYGELRARAALGSVAWFTPLFLLAMCQIGVGPALHG